MERPNGWYWVKIDASLSGHGPARDWEASEWYEGHWGHELGEVVEVGPRIPTPDEAIDVVATEREACAKIADRFIDPDDDRDGANESAAFIADAIRARK